MHIYSVNDPEFKSYGNVWDNVPSELTSPVLEALSATPIPEGSKYVASAPELEGVKDADKLGFLHDMYPDLTIRLVGDAYAERGALPGLYTALAAAENPYVAVVACDMVFASARLVVAEALAMHESGADVVAPSNKHGFEPMHAMYRKEGCLGAVHARTERGEKRVQSFFDDPAVTVLPFNQDRVLEVEPRGGCFINANTPDELARIEQSYLGE